MALDFPPSPTLNEIYPYEGRSWQWNGIAWGSNIPNMRIRLYEASNNNELLNDTVTLSSYGTWQYSTDGTTWNSWNAAQDTVGNYIRYTATSFGYSGVTVRALLTQA